jgi:hypothetical protein
MAQTRKTTTVVGNPGFRRAFGTATRYKKRAGGRAPRRNPSILGFSLAGNPGRKRTPTMAKTKKAKRTRKHAGGYAGSSYKKNPGRRSARHGHSHRNPRRNPGRMRRYRRNPGGDFMTGGVGGLVTNAVFVIIGALGSKLGAQAILGTNNVGVLGYAGNAAVGGVLWFITEKLMKNRAASAGVISGTVVQILLRVINDYTPFGSYVSQLGMGDYQMQSFVTPQVLVDPWNSAAIRVPNGWGPGHQIMSAPSTPSKLVAGTPMPSGRTAPGAAAAPAASPAAPGVSGLYGAGGWGGGLYNA